MIDSKKLSNLSNRSWSRSKRISIGCFDVRPSPQLHEKVKSNHPNRSKSPSSMFRQTTMTKSSPCSSSKMSTTTTNQVSSGPATNLLRRLRLRTKSRERPKSSSSSLVLSPNPNSSSALTRSFSAPRTPNPSQPQTSSSSDYPLLTTQLTASKSAYAINASGTDATEANCFDYACMTSMRSAPDISPRHCYDHHLRQPNAFQPNGFPVNSPPYYHHYYRLPEGSQTHDALFLAASSTIDPHHHQRSIQQSYYQHQHHFPRPRSQPNRVGFDEDIDGVPCRNDSSVLFGTPSYSANHYHQPDWTSATLAHPPSSNAQRIRQGFTPNYNPCTCWACQPGVSSNHHPNHYATYRRSPPQYQSSSQHPEQQQPRPDSGYACSSCSQCGQSGLCPQHRDVVGRTGSCESPNNSLDSASSSSILSSRDSAIGNTTTTKSDDKVPPSGEVEHSESNPLQFAATAATNYPLLSDQQLAAVFAKPSSRSASPRLARQQPLPSHREGETTDRSWARSYYQHHVHHLPPTPTRHGWHTKAADVHVSQPAPTVTTKHVQPRTNSQKARAERIRSTYVNAAIDSPAALNQQQYHHQSKTGQPSIGCLQKDPSSWAQLLPYRVSTVPQNLSDRIKKSETLPNDVWARASQAGPAMTTSPTTGGGYQSTNFDPRIARSVKQSSSQCPHGNQQHHQPDRPLPPPSNVGHLRASPGPPPPPQPPMRTTSHTGNTRSPTPCSPTSPPPYGHARPSRSSPQPPSHVNSPSTQTHRYHQHNHDPLLQQLLLKSATGFTDASSCDNSPIMCRYSQLYSLDIKPPHATGGSSQSPRQANFGPGSVKPINHHHPLDPTLSPGRRMHNLTLNSSPRPVNTGEQQLPNR